MNELLKALKDFLARDLIFLAGGATVVTSLLYVLRRLPSADDHVALYFLLAGLSYFVGYAVQDSFGILRVVTTRPPRALRWHMPLLYWLYTGDRWCDVNRTVDFATVEQRISQNEWQRVQFERMITLQQVGSVGGPSALVASCILAFRGWAGVGDPFARTLTVAGFTLGVILAHLAWLKAAQQARYLADA